MYNHILHDIHITFIVSTAVYVLQFVSFYSHLHGWLDAQLHFIA